MILFHLFISLKGKKDEKPSLEKQKAIQTTTTALEDEEVGKLPQPETRETEETAAQKEERNDVEDPTPKSACTKVCTWVPEGVVDLAIGESGIEAMKPVTVGEIFKDVEARFPRRPALKYKEDGVWKTITYTAYYNLCFKAAKSFLKVRVRARNSCFTLGQNFSVNTKCVQENARLLTLCAMLAKVNVWLYLLLFINKLMKWVVYLQWKRSYTDF